MELEPVCKRHKPEEDLPNFVLDVRGIQFFIKKSILEKESSLMRLKLLYIPEEQNHLEIPDENPLCVSKCLSFIEGRCINGGQHITWPMETFSNIEEIVTLSEVPAVLDLAYRWEIPRLKDELFHCLQRNLNLGSFYAAYEIAEKYNNPHLQLHCDKFLVRNFCQLCQNSSFLQLSKAQILSALKSPEFKTSCWTIVCESIFAWIESTGNRRHCFQELFCCLDLSNLSPEYLETQIETKTLVMHNTICLQKVHKAYREIYEKSEGFIVSSRSSSNLKVFYPLCKRSYDLEMFCLEQDIMRTGHSMLVFQGHLYVFLYSRCVFRLWLSSFDAKWQQIASTNDYHNMKPCAASLNGDLFVLGGGKVMLTTCEKYCTESNSWLKITGLENLITEQYNIAAARGSIYIIGVVIQNMQFFSSVERFNPYNGALSRVYPMHSPIKFPSTAVHEENIYVAGSRRDGVSCGMNIECLDTSTGVWATILCQHNGGLYISSVCMMQSSLYCFGNSPLHGKPEVLSVPSVCYHVEYLAINNIDPFACDFHTAFCGGLKTYDVVIKVDGKEFPAHKRILSQFSNYFKAMFSYEMIENRTNIVNMSDIDSCIIRICIDHAYCAGLPLLTNQNIELFLHAASLLQIPGMLETLTSFLMENLNVDTFQLKKHLANRYGFLEAEDACDDFATKNYKAITCSPFFTSMEKDYVQFLLKFRSMEVNDEMDAYKSILQWVNWTVGDRGCYFGELFSTLDLVKLPEEFVRTKVLSEKLVSKNVSCISKVRESLKERKELHEVICVLYKHLGIEHFMVYNPRLEKWKELWTQETERFSSFGHTRFASIGKYVYKFFRGVSLFELEYQNTSAKWKSLRDDFDFDYHHEMVATNDCLYFIDSQSIQEYNTFKKKLRTFPFNVNKNSFTAVAVENSIYIMGGIDYNEEEPTSTTKRFDIQTEMSSQRLAHMYRTRCDAAAAYLDGKIFISGGWNDEDEVEPMADVEFYDIATDCWTMIPDMNFPRKDHWACVIDGKVYVGGGDDNSPETMEYFDDNEWIWKIEVMPEKQMKFVTAGRIPYELLF